MLSNISLNSQIESDERVGCLDIREFVDGKTFKRLAFVQKVKSGVSVYETGYYTFYVKDVNGNVLAARLFNVKNFIESGFTASLYKNKPVIMEFSSQIYNGQWSLVVDKIDLWTGDFPFARFRGSVDAAKDFIMRLAHNCFGSYDLVKDEYFTVALTSIADGRCGGVAKLLEMSLSMSSALTNLPEIDVKAVQIVIFYAIEALYQCETMHDTLSIVSNTQLLQRITKTKELTTGQEFQQYIIDAIVSVYGYGKPQMLYSNLALQIIDSCRKQLDLVYCNLKIPTGMSTAVSGFELIRL